MEQTLNRFINRETWSKYVARIIGCQWIESGGSLAGDDVIAGEATVT
ncbi:MAG TPA: hypothetical protein VGJ07_02730 [Rugosimonospora sp.]